MPHASPPSLFLRNAAQLLTLAEPPVPRRGAALGELGIIPHGGVLTEGETILRVGPTRSLEREALRLRAEAIDCRGRVVMPGFVDSHTHLIFAGSRVNDYELRLRGKTYEEIAKAGGGIQSSAQRIRKTGVSVLAQQAGKFLDQFAAHGTTTVEVKSGYGLDIAQEIKILRVIRALQADAALDLVPTLLALHSLPKSFRDRPRQYVDQIIERLIPAAAEGDLRPDVPPDVEPGFSPAPAARKGGATMPKKHAPRQRLAEFIDCFCDRGAFSVEDCRRVSRSGPQVWPCAAHPRRATCTHWRRASRHRADAASADHLDKLSAADIRALARSDVVATLLPGANFHLGSESNTHPRASSLTPEPRWHWPRISTPAPAPR